MSDLVTRLNAALEGRYRIERELGEGGMATVYLADDIKHERKVALKVLKPELAAVVGAERFLAEIKTTANLQHPHILPLFDSGEAEGFLFYVMPHVEGESLREKLDREHQLPVDDAVRIASYVAEALDYAHRHGVVHRDIKPGNVLIHDGQPVISDFGIALAVGAAGGGRLTETGLSVGTPHYMSPEQATGDQTVGATTDIYALGCVLYEMLVGEPPYVGSTAQAILGKIIAGKLASATEQRASVPANVDAAIRKALEKLPADRFATAEELVRALGDAAFRHGEAVAPAPGGDAGRGWLWGVAGVAIGIAAGIYFGGADRSSEGLGPVHFAFPVAETAELWSTRNYAAVAISRDGSTIGYAANTSYGGGQFVRPISGRELRSFVSGQWTYGPFFDSAGERMAYVVDGKRLEAVGADGAGRVTLATFQTFVHSGRWGPDGSIVVSLGEHGLVRVSPGSATQDTLTRPDSAAGEVSHEWPEFLPGGESLLFTIRYDDGSDSISVLSLPDREIRRGIIEGAHGKYVRTGHLLFARDDGILVAPFDAEGASVTGPLERMVENVASGGAAFDVAETGTLVYEPRSARVRRLFWVDEGGVATTLPVEPAEYFGPRLSPDRRRIGVAIGGQAYDIWSIDASSGAARQIAFAGQSQSLVWSPDGRYGYYNVEESGVLHRIDADGSNHVEIDSGLGPLDAHPVDVSPDGAWLALNWWDDAGPGASALNLQTGEVVPISDPNDGTGQEAAFSPDGALVAYTNVATDGTYRVVVRTFPDTRAGRWNVGEQGASSPLWAPDGSRIFVRYRTRLAQIPIALTPTFDFGPSSDLFDGPYTWSIGETAYDYDPVGRRFLMVESTAPDQIMVVLNWFEELRQRVSN